MDQIPHAALRVWSHCLSAPTMTRHGATRHRVPFDYLVDLEEFEGCSWPHAGFTDAKLSYLRRRYPPDSLPADGCIAHLWRSTPSDLVGQCVYRRVDSIRGWLADLIYLRWLGWRGLVRFRMAPGSLDATLHAVNASAIAPAIMAAGLWRPPSLVVARTLRRAVVHRLERRHESRAQTKRVNDWAHRVATPDAMRATVAAIDAQLRVPCR